MGSEEMTLTAQEKASALSWALMPISKEMMLTAQEKKRLEECALLVEPLRVAVNKFVPHMWHSQMWVVVESELTLRQWIAGNGNIKERQELLALPKEKYINAILGIYHICNSKKVRGDEGQIKYYESILKEMSSLGCSASEEDVLIMIKLNGLRSSKFKYDLLHPFLLFLGRKLDQNMLQNGQARVLLKCLADVYAKCRDRMWAEELWVRILMGDVTDISIGESQGIKPGEFQGKISDVEIVRAVVLAHLECGRFKVKNYGQNEAWKKIRAFSPPDLTRTALFLLDKLNIKSGYNKNDNHGVWQDFLCLLFNLKFELPRNQLIKSIEYIISDEVLIRFYSKPLILYLTRNLDAEQLSKDAELKQVLNKFASVCADSIETEKRHLVTQIRALLNSAAGPDEIVFPLSRHEPWAIEARRELTALPLEQQKWWSELMMLCMAADGSKPTGKWLKQVEAHLKQFKRGGGFELCKSRFMNWFPLVKEPMVNLPIEYYIQPLSLSLQSADLLKGFAWVAGLKPDEELARALRELALASYKKIPDVGPRAGKVGNACLWALGNMGTRDAVGQIAILQIRIKNAIALKSADKALNEAAEKLGLPRQEVEEISVPTYGMEEVGLRVEELGPYRVELRVREGGGTEFIWFNETGARVKSAPAALKREYAEDLKELQTAAKELQKMLPAQGQRLDNLFLAQRKWSLNDWRERYLDHPLVGTLARRLIWEFTTQGQARSAIWHKGSLVDVDGRSFELSETCSVELWHPISRPLEEVQAWRARLETLEIQQPFKQAHREVYLLTDAERNTRTYSNRFAAHILKQHPYNALCHARNWSNMLRLNVDAEVPPSTKQLPLWGLRAEFWVESFAQDEDVTEAGVYLYISSDQVRFYALDAARHYAHAAGGGYGTGQYTGMAPGESIPLEQIPPLLFSEVMRDVDLFTGVCSVANDPTWQDGGPQGRHHDYWHQVSFGDLNESARTRRDVLERLIPKLKIREQCSFLQKFLVVKGKLRTYKIHLGSGNILMEPNDQYLCIVADRSKQSQTEGLRLPFEGDSMLTVILSKAFLLAADDKITAPDILRQIHM